MVLALIGSPYSHCVLHYKSHYVLFLNVLQSHFIVSGCIKSLVELDYNGLDHCVFNISNFVSKIPSNQIVSSNVINIRHIVLSINF